MTNSEIARTYLECFCNGDVVGLSEVLAPGLRFSGPLFQFESSSQYLASLEESPLEQCSYNLIEIAETKNAVLVFYEYVKTTGTVLVAQLFKFRESKINEIFLVFDTAQVA